MTNARTVRMGENLFVNDDAISAAHAHIPDASVDLIVTDPPYGIGGDHLDRHYNRNERFVVDGYVEVPAERYESFTREWVGEAVRILRPGGQIYVVSGYTNLHVVLNALHRAALREINHIIWKYNFGVYTRTKYVSSHYHILYYAKPGGERTFNLQCRFAADEPGERGGSLNYRDREDVWTINREYKPAREKNKNELPRALLQKIIAYSSNERDLVCDLFLGGCSTAAVAIGMNRRFVGFEISAPTFASRVPRLFDVASGALLQNPAPRPYRHCNGGKRWSDDESSRLRTRYGELRGAGERVTAILRLLSSEFGRGQFAIRKRLVTPGRSGSRE